MWLNPGQIVKRVRLGGPEVVLLFQRAVAAVVGAGGNGDNPHTLPQTLYWALDTYFSCICLFDLYRNPRGRYKQYPSLVGEELEGGEGRHFLQSLDQLGDLNPSLHGPLITATHALAEAVKYRTESSLSSPWISVQMQGWQVPDRVLTLPRCPDH